MPRRKTPFYPRYAEQAMDTEPDWVWSRAYELVDSDRRVSLRRDGPDIARVMRYLRAGLNGHRGRWGSHRKEDPTIYAMIAFSESLGHISRTAELELRCNVLSRRSLGWLAATYQLPRPVMQTYLTTFFNIAHRLHQRSYILHRVIRLSGGHPPGAYELAQLHAWTKGPEAVRPWMDWFRDQHDPPDLGTPEGRRHEALSIALDAQWLNFDGKQAARLAKIELSSPDLVTKTFQSRSPAGVLRAIHGKWLAGMQFRSPSGPDPKATNAESDAAGVSACEAAPTA